MKLTHVDPALNVKELWYVLVGESPTHYFCLIDGKNGHASSVMHAVSRADYRKEGEANNVEEFL